MIRPAPRVEVAYRAVEAFCGPGGMSLGLHNAGFNLVAAFDADAFAVETHCRNLPGLCFQAQVEDIKGLELLDSLDLNEGELELFAGGPPCQGFSKQKRGAHHGDTRNELILTEDASIFRQAAPV